MEFDMSRLGGLVFVACYEGLSNYLDKAIAEIWDDAMAHKEWMEGGERDAFDAFKEQREYERDETLSGRSNVAVACYATATHGE